MSKSKFFVSLDKRLDFCDVIIGRDIKDQLYDNVSFTVSRSGYPNIPARVAISISL
ncbi:hypothetical protein [Endozoicomonas arenosclerae]|uniref:hypothetical protein n=1 Tax=Endozoicomonas arenosclerae TaxID=1633495 RepID=UPI001FDEC648|nr:hypothetical protein [Endozoicomonas arenosclerae]